MHIPIILAHGAIGPLDELLPPILLGGIIGMIAITWWNGRKANFTAVPTDRPEIPPDAPIITSSDVPDDHVTHAEALPIDELHFPVN